ncbi:MAG: hypothetical protein MHM6MM_000410 [Cercozoa sp. M6MM]
MCVKASLTAAGDFKSVRMLAKRGANVHACTREGCNCLHYAAQNNSVQMLRFLLSHGVVPTESRHGVRPEHCVNDTLPCAADTLAFLVALGNGARDGAFDDCADVFDVPHGRPQVPSVAARAVGNRELCAAVKRGLTARAERRRLRELLRDDPRFKNLPVEALNKAIALLPVGEHEESHSRLSTRRNGIVDRDDTGVSVATLLRRQNCGNSTPQTPPRCNDAVRLLLQQHQDVDEEAVRETDDTDEDMSRCLHTNDENHVNIAKSLLVLLERGDGYDMILDSESNEDMGIIAA